MEREYSAWFTRYGHNENMSAQVGYDMYTLAGAIARTTKITDQGIILPGGRSGDTGYIAPGVANTKAEYVYHPPAIALVLGALAGWIPTTIVAIASAQRQRRQEVLAAGMGSVIIVLILRYGAAIQLPISLTVNDIYGAMIVGLLSRRLTKPLLDWLGFDKANGSGAVTTGTNPAGGNDGGTTTATIGADQRVTLSARRRSADTGTSCEPSLIAVELNFYSTLDVRHLGTEEMARPRGRARRALRSRPSAAAPIAQRDRVLELRPSDGTCA